MEGEFVERDGGLYVLYRDVCYTTPERFSSWYRVTSLSGSGYGYAPVVGDRLVSVSSGVWSASRNGTPTGTVTRTRLRSTSRERLFRSPRFVAGKSFDGIAVAGKS